MIVADRPVSSLSDDEFGLVASFIPRLTRIVIDWPREEGLVVGMYGSWGVGKTSALNMFSAYVKREHVRYPNVYVCGFNPWFYEDPSILITSFFSTIAAELGKDDEKPWARAARALRAMGAFLSVASRGVSVLGVRFETGVISDALRAGDEALRQTTELTTQAAGFAEIAMGGQRKLDEHRDVVARALRQLGGDGGRIVVLIDDVDRLNRAELLALLRLVRLVGDLPFVSIVLAIDDDRIRDVLETVADEGYGKAYLDKIVQVGIHVPLPGRDILHRKLQRDLERIFATRDIPYPDELRPSVGRGSDGALEVLLECFQTPRDLARYVNSLAVLLLSGEEEPDIHPVDAALIEALHVVHPQIYDRVRRRKDFFTREATSHDAAADPTTTEGMRQTRVRELARVIDGESEQPLNDSSQQAVTRLLVNLFGELIDPRKMVTDATASTLRRIRSPAAFDTYFRFTNSVQVGRRTVKELLDQLVDLSDTETSDQLAERLTAEFSQRDHATVERILQDLGFHLKQYPVPALRRIGTAVTVAASTLPATVVLPLLTSILDALGEAAQPATGTGGHEEFTAGDEYAYWWLHSLVTRELQLADAFHLLYDDRICTWIAPLQRDTLVHLWLEVFDAQCRSGKLLLRVVRDRLAETFLAASKIVSRLGESSFITEEDISAHLVSLLEAKPEFLEDALRLATCSTCGNHMLFCAHQSIDDAFERLAIAFGSLDALDPILARIASVNGGERLNTELLRQFQKLLAYQKGEMSSATGYPSPPAW